MSNPELDLSIPIIGNLSDTLQTIMPDERATFLFFAFAGKPAVKTAIMIEQVAMLEPDTHLERFEGIDVSEGDDNEPGIVPGKKIVGIKNLNFGLVFLTDIDGQPVEPYEGFYNKDDWS